MQTKRYVKIRKIVISIQHLNFHVVLYTKTCLLPHPYCNHPYKLNFQINNLSFLQQHRHSCWLKTIYLANY